MKKQSNLAAAGKKLSLNKKTISNLSTAEMNKHIGGAVDSRNTYTCSCYCTWPTACHGKTCNKRCTF